MPVLKRQLVILIGVIIYALVLAQHPHRVAVIMLVLKARVELGLIIAVQEAVVSFAAFFEKLYANEAGIPVSFAYNVKHH